MRRINHLILELLKIGMLLLFNVDANVNTIKGFSLGQSFFPSNEILVFNGVAWLTSMVG